MSDLKSYALEDNQIYKIYKRVFDDPWLLYQLSLVNLETFLLIRSTFANFYRKTIPSSKKDDYYNLLYEHYGTRDAYRLCQINSVHGMRWLCENPLNNEVGYELNETQYGDLLLKASEYGHLEFIKYILQYGKIKASIYDNKAIILASYRGHLDIVKYFASLPEVDASADENSAICVASAKGYLDIVKFLSSSSDPKLTIQNYPALKNVNPADRQSRALCLAASNGHLDVVKYLLTFPNVKAYDDNNKPIRFAASSGHLDVVKFLSTFQGVDASAEKNYAVKNAYIHGYQNVVNYLLTLPGVYLDIKKCVAYGYHPVFI